MALAEAEQQPEPERACRNCAARAESRFCPECGQETEDPTVSLGVLARDVWEEFFKWDSKLLNTLRAMVFRPGRLTREYLDGRRASYISPFKLYFWASALYFFVSGVSHTDQYFLQQIDGLMGRSKRTVQAAAARRDAEARETAQASNPKAVPRLQAASTAPDGAPTSPSDPEGERLEPPTGKRAAAIRLLSRIPEATVRAARWYIENQALAMICSLPVVAGALRLLFIRHRHVYLAHLIFSVHFLAFQFLLLALLLGVAALLKIPFYTSPLQPVYWVGIWIYSTLGLRQVHQQSVMKSGFKSAVLIFGEFAALQLFMFSAVMYFLLRG